LILHIQLHLILFFVVCVYGQSKYDYWLALWTIQHLISLLIVLPVYCQLSVHF